MQVPPQRLLKLFAIAPSVFYLITISSSVYALLLCDMSSNVVLATILLFNFSDPVIADILVFNFSNPAKADIFSVIQPSISHFHYYLFLLDWQSSPPTGI